MPLNLKNQKSNSKMWTQSKNYYFQYAPICRHLRSPAYECVLKPRDQKACNNFSDTGSKEIWEGSHLTEITSATYQARRLPSRFGVLVVSIQFVCFLNGLIAHRFRHCPYCVVATMELIALMTVVVSICDHRSFRYYSEAWQSEHHRASCEYSYPICGAWGNQSTTWDNPTTVSLMALYDSGEFCLTVLFDAVASLSNSYLDMDFMGQV